MAMELDLEYLRHSYASLSDEALMEIDRADLVGAAQQCFDDEFRSRRLRTPGSTQESKNEDSPEWIEDAFEAYSATDHAGAYRSFDAEAARNVLEAAGVPCFLDFFEDPPVEFADVTTHTWRIRVPARFSMRATNILDRDIFNDEFEAAWKAHLEQLSNEELSESGPKEVFCGLFDKVDRVVRAYSDELARRGLKAGAP